MGKGSRQRQQRDERRRRLGLDDAHLSRKQLRALDKALEKSETLDEVAAGLSEYSLESVVLAANLISGDTPPFAVGRLVREAAQSISRGRRSMRAREARTFARRLMNVFEPEAIIAISDNTAHELVINRVMTDQIALQRNFTTDLIRTMNVLFDDTGPSMLDREHWVQRLGTEPGPFCLGTHTLAQAMSTGPVDVEQFIARDELPGIREVIESVMQRVSTDLDGLAASTASNSDRVHELGPLIATPVVQLSDGRAVAPSPTHLEVAASPPALYVQLLREDSQDGTRERAKLVGERLEEHLTRWAEAALPSGWVIKRLDQEPAGGHSVSDIALWPRDGRFLIVIEAKATLSSAKAQLGSQAERERMLALYQKAYDQIAATVRSIGVGGFLASAPTDVPTFGLCATLDTHFTTVADGETHFGVVLGYRDPSESGANADEAECRVVRTEEVEMLLDALGSCNSQSGEQLMTHIAAADSPVNAVRRAIADVFTDSAIQAIPVNDVASEAFQSLVDSLPEGGMREVAQEAVNLNLNDPP